MKQSLSWYFSSNLLYGTIFSTSKNLEKDMFSGQFVKFVAEWYKDQQSAYIVGATTLQRVVAEKLMDVLIDKKKIVRKVIFSDFTLNIVLERPWKKGYMPLFETVIIETCEKVEFVKA